MAISKNIKVNIDKTVKPAVMPTNQDLKKLTDISGVKTISADDNNGQTNGGSNNSSSYYDQLKEQTNDYYNNQQQTSDDYYNNRKQEYENYYNNRKTESKNYYNNLLKKMNDYYSNRESENSEYYNNLRNVRYKDLFEQKVGIANANALAQKYAQNALIAKGYGSQGLSETAQAGYANAYYNALGNANANYQSDLNTINSNETQTRNDLADSKFSNEMSANQNQYNESRSDSETYQDYLNTLANNQYQANLSLAQQKFEQTLTNMTNEHNENRTDSATYGDNLISSMETFTSVEDLNNYLTTSGLMTDGVLNETALSDLGLSKTQIALIKQSYNSAVATLENNANETATSGTEIGEDGVKYYYNKNGVAQNNITGYFNDEYKALQGMITRGEVKDGEVLKLVNGYGDYAYVQYKNGKLYYTTASDNATEVNPHGYDGSIDVSKMQKVARIIRPSLISLNNAIKNGSVSNNDYIKVSYKSGKTMYFLYKDGELYYSDKEAYGKAKSQKQVDGDNV